MGYFFIERDSSMRRAGESIARANEYWGQEALLYEPRYLEAQKTVADVTGTDLDRALLRSCLSTVNTSRGEFFILSRLMTLRDEGKKAGASKKDTAETDAHIKEGSAMVDQLRVKARACISDAAK